MKAAREQPHPTPAMVQNLPRQAVLHPKVEKYLHVIAEDGQSWFKTFLRVYEGKASPRNAIKAKCGECCHFDRAAITECTAAQCPLWSFRPFQKGGES